MFNHARTLLLNQDGRKAAGPDFPGEELVPVEYRELSLPSYLINVRSKLFGNTPDRAMLNYRIHQYLSLLHSTELSEFITDLDHRITYEDSEDNRLVFAEMFQPKVNQIEGVAADLTVTGSPTSPDISGKSKFEFSIDVLTTDTIEIKKLVPPVSSTIESLSLVSGLSSEYSLVDTGFRFRVNTNNAGAAWRVSGYLRPQWSLGVIAANLDRIGETTLVELFGVEQIEPWLTFKRLWYDNNMLPYRLGGLLLALIYRTEQVRVING